MFLKLIVSLSFYLALSQHPSMAQQGSGSLLPLFDAHLHYSHDAAELIPPNKALEILRAAGIKIAVVSSSNDEGTQTLHRLAPDLILPSLRPYRTRADVSSWLQGDANLVYMRERLARYRYVAIGEFHVSGEQARSPVMKASVELAKQHQLVLHAHADAAAVEILFQHDPNATILWAHAGFDQPDAIASLLKKYPRLYSDLAFRSDYASNGELDPGWKKLFEQFPDRFMAGTDTYTPERWAYVGDYAQWVRLWLGKLPPGLRERIAYKNGEALFAPFAARMRAANSANRSDVNTVGATGSCGIEQGWLPLRAANGQELFVKTSQTPSMSKLFTAQVSTCSEKTLQIAAVDVVMPEHRHGMNYKPRIQQLSPQHAQVSGLVLHMPGRWVWQLDASVGADSKRRFSAELTVP